MHVLNFNRGALWNNYSYQLMVASHHPVKSLLTHPEIEVVNDISLNTNALKKFNPRANVN